jgi:hypothetical protein
MFFEFMSMILKIRTLKVDVSIFLKNASRFFFKNLGCPKKQSRFKVDEILDSLIFLVNGHPNFSYALSTSKVKIIIY